MAQNFIPAMKSLQDWWEANESKVFAILWEAGEAKILRDAGWVWHRTFKWRAADPHARDVGTYAEQFYAREWAATKAELLAGLLRYGPDDQAVSTFQQALELHELGYYRAVVRLVFPEIERLTKKALNLPSTGAGETSLPSFRKLALDVHFSDGIPDRPFAALTLFDILNEHLYEPVKGEEKLRKFEQSDIPNRHACIHGAIDYSSAKHSLNAIFLADYILQLVASFEPPSP